MELIRTGVVKHDIPIVGVETQFRPYCIMEKFYGRDKKEIQVILEHSFNNYVAEEVWKPKHYSLLNQGYTPLVTNLLKLYMSNSRLDHVVDLMQSKHFNERKYLLFMLDSFNDKREIRTVYHVEGMKERCKRLGIPLDLDPEWEIL